MSTQPIRSFRCTVAGYESIVNARTAGEARYQRYLSAQEWHPDVRFIDIRVNVVKGQPVAPEGFDEVCRRRGVPFAKVGMRVEVDGKPGAIVGHNYSANFDVLFDGERYPMNCHPTWRMRYFADDGTELNPEAP